MKYYSLYLLVGVLLFSCEKKHDDGAVSMSVEMRDSLIVEHAIREFDYDWDPGLYENSKRRFHDQLNRLRNDTALRDYTHEAEFKNYRLKSFLFDSHGKPPFVVEITNKEGKFINLFSFTDELFYSHNTVSLRRSSFQSAKQDSVYQKKINLEKNLNQLVEKLSLKDKDDIFHLIKSLCNTLEMRQISRDGIEHQIESLCSDTRGIINDSICNLIKVEQTAFFEKGKGEILMVNTQCYLGYWRIWIEDLDGKPVIKAIFFSDILYTPVWV